MQRKQARPETPEYLLRHNSPLGWQHILLIGEYFWLNINRIHDLIKWRMQNGDPTVPWTSSLGARY